MSWTMIRFVEESARMRLALSMAALMVALSACSEDEILEGERIAVRVVDDLEVAGSPEVRTLPPVEALAEWPQRGGNSGRSGFHPSFDGKRVTVWQYGAPAGVSSDWPISAEPVVADGKVFVLDGRTEVHAVRVNDGGASWRVSLEPEEESGLGGVGGGIAHDTGRLFVTTSYAEVAALDAGDGSILWRRELSAPAHAAPAVADGRVVVLTRDDGVFILDAATGETLWDASGPGAQAVYLMAPAPAVSAGTLIVPFSSGELGAFSLDGGESLWRRILASGEEDSPLALFRDITAEPVMDGDLVYAGTRRGEFSAFAWRTGEIAWQLPVGSPKPAWTVDGSVFLLDANSRIARVNALDGLILWRRQLPAFEDPEDHEDPIHYTAPVLAGGLVLLGSTEGRLLAFDAVGGGVAWEHILDEGLRASPVIAGGVAYLFLDDGTLIAMR